MAVNTDHGKELSSIDFASMIGGPLSAVVQAQAMAAGTTIDFIKEVGFKKPPPPAGGGDDFGELIPGENAETGDPIYVTFTYPKEISPYLPPVEAVTGVTGVTEVRDAAGNITTPEVTAVTAVTAAAAVPAVYQDQKFSVPFLTIVPIPYLRVEETTIDFNAKINSISRVSEKSILKSKTKVGYSAFFSPVKINTSFSYQKQSSNGTTVNRTYSLAIHVRACADELPAGMDKVLGILEDAIVSTPTESEKAHPAIQ